MGELPATVAGQVAGQVPREDCCAADTIGKGGAEEERGGLLGFLGADARNRTEDPIITSDVLCQLSYVGSEDALGF